MLTAQQLKDYQQNGYLVFPEFFPAEQMDALKQRAEDIVEQFDASQQKHIFTTKDHEKTRDQYFLTSEDQVRCFFEEDAFSEQGELVQDKALCINKIGHALHTKEPLFHRFSHQSSIAGIARELGLKQPQIHQSMYIFKQPRIGGDVRWHQDATYFFSDPISVTTFWLAIEDATIENGCLWAQPGGHRSPLRERFVRGEDDCTELQKLDTQPWPAKQDTVPLEVKKGSLVVFHGLLPHGSEPNRSDRSRHAYTLHVTCATTEYADSNWLRTPASQDWQEE